MAPIHQDPKDDWIRPYMEMFQEDWADWDWFEEYYDTGFINYEAVDDISFGQLDNVPNGIPVLYPGEEYLDMDDEDYQYHLDAQLVEQENPVLENGWDQIPQELMEHEFGDSLED